MSVENTTRKEERGDLYCPYEHRNVKKPNSDIRSLANLVKSSLGSGILAIPLAFSHSGWGLGIVGTIIISIICTHCVHIFVSSSYTCCVIERQPSMSYAETCHAAFANGPKGVRPYASAARAFAFLALLCTYLGVCCIFTVLIAESIKQLLDTYVQSFVLSTEYYCLILLVPLCILVQIKHLKFLAPLSLLANIFLIATFVICLYFIFEAKLDIKDKKVIGTWQEFPAFLSTVIFAMEGIGVVMPVENNMKKPQHFLGCPSVLVIAMGLVTVLYTVLGVFGYLRYGDVLRGTITLNLPMNHWLAICAKSFIALSIFLTYPLHFYVVIDIITNTVIKPYVKDQYVNIAGIATRAAIVIGCGGVAMALPLLEQIINIVGALFYSILGLIIPGIIDTVCKWDNLGKSKWILWKNILIVLFGLTCAISGTMVTVFDIIRILGEKTE
ncbi:proton-coupled amino acid transporter-like protein pathetic [Hyposmocoma kahamanoa]|uniref:proton-coupled amino acid transporter-like protein pathetic n=1 Tax=Hyposmocoma kahamanoa TaxID=1477025 RepID=UPI000E6D5F74|nr:proton-coupled amino acid transporter-like protein pathetic [Hyposmocoma kahamanoa]